MNLFNPRTFSTDWEVMVIDKLDRCVETEKLMGFAGVLRHDLELPVQIDWNTLEFAMGINTSFDQLWQRIQQVTDRASQLVREFDCELFPCGSHPLMPMFNAAHVHVGTLRDESMGIHLENQMMKYVPAFGALAANSPVSYGQSGQFKSYRIKHKAHGCTQPGVVRDPQMTQSTWGGDASPKLQGGLTMEVRIQDCASSRRLLAEMATFIAAYVQHQGTRVEKHHGSPDEYRDNMTNRWAASRYGMQATFCWDGQSWPVADMLNTMLDECAEELKLLGVHRNDLQLINMMIEKRICQADFVLDLAARYPDPWCLTSVHSKLVRHWDVFDDYLAKASALEPVPALDDAAILNAHLEVIGEGTHFYRTRDAMYYPPTVADEVINQMEAEGYIRREVLEDRSILLHRIS